MVAHPYHRLPAALRRSSCVQQRFSGRTLCIYVVLVDDEPMKVEITRRKTLETHGVLAIACCVFFYLSKNPNFLYAGGFFVLIGLFVPQVAFHITKLWFLFGEAIGAVMSRVVLSVLFYVILTPIALAYRFFQKKALMQVQKDNPTYLITRDHLYNKDDFVNPW